ncbi:WW domain-containing oxidoreductase [Eumeta japonica]|uniref:WW domain-containing oxidoreductase n=1 Tax=Eumeta variegata TaxID=151549 RepID=A0A4C1TWK1_EUMVA|nr:WW domain-containing oxidoreductase [Eumeta japonica]
MHNIDSDSEDEIPPGWEEKATEDGNVYFVNTCNREIQWTHPRTGRKKVIPTEMPFGWAKTLDENGETVYFNKETGNKTYIDPRLAFAKDEKKYAYDFRQRFDASSTAFQVLHGIDLSGKYAVITGCNVGIGYETAKSLARHGCKVLMANRNIDSTKEAIKNIVKETNAPESNLMFLQLDLSSLHNVKTFSEQVATIFSRFASLKNVFVDENISMKEDSYSSMMAYNNSKLFNVLSAKQQAAATTVYVAVAPELEEVTGLYFNNCFYCEESALAKDKDIAEEVFKMSVKIIEQRMGPIVPHSSDM